MRAGVTVVDPATTWVDVDVTLEPDAVIQPGTQLHGAHARRRGRRGRARLHPDRHAWSARTRSSCNAVCDSAEIGPEASVGPFAYLRPGTSSGRKAKVGTYVEMKNAEVGAGSKVPHLSYVGDADDRRGLQHRRRLASSSTTTASSKHQHRGRRPRRRSAATPCSSRR